MLSTIDFSSETLHPGRRWQMLGLEDPYGEETAQYEETTRARKLAMELVRVIEGAEGPVTVMVTGGEPVPGDGTPDTWGEALRTAARAGATMPTRRWHSSTRTRRGSCRRQYVARRAGQ